MAQPAQDRGLIAEFSLWHHFAYDADMADEPESIVLAYLRRMDGKLDLLVEDVRDLKLRVTSLEGQIADLHRQVANLHGDFAGQSARMDRIDGRLDRIERRLDLPPAR